jgi:hypothetical protein
MIEPNVIPIVFINKSDLSHLNHVQPFKFLHRLLEFGIEIDDAKNRRYIPPIGVCRIEFHFVGMYRMITIGT